MLSSSTRAQAPKRVAEETRRLYGDLFTANQVPDATLLLRPNYKLIEQMVKNLITETGLLRDVFNASDFESNTTAATKSADKIKTKRMQFVQKLINYAANNEQPVVGCVASKVISGLEPIKCNELLQALAKLAQKRIISHQERRSSSSASVRQRTFTRTSTGSSGQVHQVKQVKSQPIKIRHQSLAAKPAPAAAPAPAPDTGGDSKRASVQAKTPARTEASKVVVAAAAAAANRPSLRQRQRQESGASEASSDSRAAKGTKHDFEDDKESEDNANSNQNRPQSKAQQQEQQVNKTGTRAPPVKSAPAAKINLRDELRSLHKTMANIVDLSESIEANLVRTSHLVQ